MCTARTSKPRAVHGMPSCAIALNKQAESAPPLTATSSPVAPAGTCCSSTAPSMAAPKLIRLGVCVAEHAEAAEAGLPRIQERRDGLVAKFRQILDQALFEDFRHGLRIAMRGAMRLFQDFVDQTQLLQP